MESFKRLAVAGTLIVLIGTALAGCCVMPWGGWHGGHEHGERYRGR